MTDEAPGGLTDRGVEPGILLKGIFSGLFYPPPPPPLFFFPDTRLKVEGKKENYSL